MRTIRLERIEMATNHAYGDGLPSDCERERGCDLRGGAQNAFRAITEVRRDKPIANDLVWSNLNRRA